MGAETATGTRAARTAETKDEAGQDGSLRHETQAAARAAVAHIRKVAATASTEAQLSAASVLAVLGCALAALMLLLAAWLLLLAAAVWAATQAGMSTPVALALAAAANLVAVLLFVLRSVRLVRNIGFSRTFRLIFPGPQ